MTSVATWFAEYEDLRKEAKHFVDIEAQRKQTKSALKKSKQQSKDTSNKVKKNKKNIAKWENRIKNCEGHWFLSKGYLQPQLWCKGGIEGKIERTHDKLEEGKQEAPALKLAAKHLEQRLWKCNSSMMISLIRILQWNERSYKKLKESQKKADDASNFLKDALRQIPVGTKQEYSQYWKEWNAPCAPRVPTFKDHDPGSINKYKEGLEDQSWQAKKLLEQLHDDAKKIEEVIQHTNVAIQEERKRIFQDLRNKAYD